MKLLIAASLTLTSLYSWSQNQAESPNKPSSTPSQACSRLIEAAKADDYEAVHEMTMAHEQKKQAMNKKHKEKFDKMHKEYLSQIRDMTCGTEQIAGDRAMVTAETRQEKRLIPFIQSEGQWKFDMRTYKAFYMSDKKDKKQKSM